MAEAPATPQLRPVEAFPAEVEGREVVCLRDPTGLTQAVLTVPRTLAPILALFDGTRSLVDVQGEIVRACGEIVPRSQLESMLEILDEHLFLEGPRADAERARQRAAFLAAPSRPAFLAGRSYDDEPGGLAAALAGHFEAPDGPGPIGAPRDVRVHGLVAPHIDFTRGGPAYAWAYRALAEARDADCFIVLGTAHSGLDGHSFAATAKAFETPFGPLEVDREVLDAVARRAPDDLFAAELAHRGEHSVEFQAVWLRYLQHRAGGGERRIVPLLASFVHECLFHGKSPDGEPAHRAGAGRPPGRDGHGPAALLHRGGGGSRPRGPALRRRVAGGRDPARARRIGGPGAPRSGGPGRCRRVLRGGAPAAGPEPDLRPVAHLCAPPAPAHRNRSAPPLRAVARSRGCGHVRERELRAGGDAPVSLPTPEAGRDPGLAGVFRIDREGAWRHDGVEVTHPGVLRNLYANLRAEGESHHLQAGPVRVPVHVDDAPFVVVRAEAGSEPSVIELHLSDGSREPLDAGTLVVDSRGVPYCRVKGGGFRARLSVAAWLQLATRIETDPGSGAAVLRLGDRRIPLGQGSG